MIALLGTRRFIASKMATELTIRLVPPEEGSIQLGMVRFTTVGAGDFDKVTFLLNDRPILTKTRPPFSVELDLGEIPEAHRLRVDGFDAEGRRVATDEILVNPGGQRFRHLPLLSLTITLLI